MRRQVGYSSLIIDSTCEKVVVLLKHYRLANHQMFINYLAHSEWRKNKSLIEFGLKNPMERGTTTMEIKKPTDKKTFKKVEDTIFKFEKVGTSIEGEYLAKEQSGNFGNDAYKLKVKDSTVVIFGTAVLSRKMDSCKIGDYVRIVRTDDIENKNKGQKPILNFDVFIAE